MKIRALVTTAIALALMSSGSLTYADSSTLPYSQPTILDCSLCKLPGPAPVVKESEEPQAKKKKEKWYFMSYWPDALVHGPFSSKKNCEESRDMTVDADRCFLDLNYKFIK